MESGTTSGSSLCSQWVKSVGFSWWVNRPLPHGPYHGTPRGFKGFFQKAENEGKPERSFHPPGNTVKKVSLAKIWILDWILDFFPKNPKIPSFSQFFPSHVPQFFPNFFGCFRQKNPSPRSWRHGSDAESPKVASSHCKQMATKKIQKHHLWRTREVFLGDFLINEPEILRNAPILYTSRIPIVVLRRQWCSPYLLRSK